MGAVKYRVTNIPSGVTLSKTSNIDPNETVDITLANNVVEGSTINLTVYAVDETGEEVSKIVSIPVNNNPVATTILATRNKTRYPKNETNTISFSGATDADSETITYSISNIPTGVTFSKVSGIAENESVNITVGSSVTAGADLTATVTATDPNGGSNSKSFDIPINTPPTFTTFTGSIPSRVVPGQSYNITLDGAADAESEALTYSVSGSSGLSFSKTDGITAGETIVMTVASDVTRGTTLTVTATATDINGDSASKNVNTLVNTAPNVSSLTCSLPSIVKPGTAYTPYVSGATDAQGDTLTYTITSNQATIANASGISANTSFNLTTPDTSSVARGSTWTLEVTVSDGYETTSKTFTYTQNSLPTAATTVTFASSTIYSLQSTTFTISGGTDADGQTVKYNITNIGTGLSFSKTSNISANETITITVPKNTSTVEGNTISRSFQVQSVDTLGEVSASNKSATIYIKTIARTSTPSISSPTSGNENVARVFTMTWSAYATYSADS